MKYLISIIISFSVSQVHAQKLVFEDSIIIKLKSGATVAATVCRNILDTLPEPAILMYSIYASPQVNKAYASIAATKGYVGVVVNTRGKWLSQDSIRPFEHDAEDVYDIIDWISKQSWCNGKVAMYGASYAGFSQWSAVKKLHPALKTIVPQAAVGPGLDFPAQNNVFSTYMLQWIHYVANNKTIDPADFSNSKHWDSVFRTWYTTGRSFNALDSIDGRPNKIFKSWLKHPGYDQFWKRLTPQEADFSSLNIPILTITGYYDDDQLGALHYFKEHIKNNKNANHYLVIGPYDHVGVQSFITPNNLLGYKTDSVASIKIFDLVFGWFDYVLKDSSKPELLKDKINYQVMGANKWEHTSSFNSMNNDTLTFYLSKGNHLLPNIEKASDNYSNFSIDYSVRTDTAGMDKGINIVDSFLNANKNTKQFISAPLKEDIQMNGSLIGELNIVINKKDADFTIQLYELRADGKYFLLNNSVFRASYAKNNSNRNLLMPGRRERVPIHNTYFVSKLIKRGSRLVFVTGINKNYNWEFNYGMGKDVSSESILDAEEPLVMKIHANSFIKMPVSKKLHR